MSKFVDYLKKAYAEGIETDDVLKETRMVNSPYIVTQDSILYAKGLEAEIERLRAENETLRRDVRTAVMGDSAELQDVKRENEKLRVQLNDQIASSQQLRGLIAQYSQQYVRMREALKPFAYYASQIPDDISDTCSASGTVGDLRAAAAAIRDTE